MSEKIIYKPESLKRYFEAVAAFVAGINSQTEMLILQHLIRSIKLVSTVRALNHKRTLLNDISPLLN